MANVLITGTSSGFGKLAALAFARNGDTVFATMRNTSKGADLERIRDEEKLSLRVLQLDVLDEASIARAVAEAGRIDVLVNNAGFELRSPIELADEDEVRSQFDTNVFGVLRLIRAVVPQMRERKSGTVINVSSVAGIVGVPYGGLYSATKHAVEAISEVLHYELHPFNIRVAIVEPGAFETEFGGNIVRARRFSADSPYSDMMERFNQGREKLNPTGAVADPGDVARAIVEAAYTEAPKLRYLVGNDAKLIGAVRAQTDFEGFEQAMRQTLDWWE